MDNNIYVYIGGTRTSLVTLAASSGIAYETILARYKAGVSAENLTADALDTEPVEDSEKAITSGAVYTAIQALADDISSLGTDKMDKVTGATGGNLAEFTSSGAIADSGIAYEAGTWTPGLVSGGGSSTLSSTSGHYIRIGKMVVVNANFTISSIASGNYARVTGLPFSVAYAGNAVVYSPDAITSKGLVAEAAAGGTNANLYAIYGDATGNTSNFTTGTMRFTLVYFAQ